jgi:alkaline phosphatase D
MPLNRRQLLALGAGFAGLSRGQSLEPARVFPQGLASGDPTATGAVFWIRVAPEVYQPDEPLWLELSPTPEFDQVNTLPIDHSWGPDTDFTARLKVAGMLEPASFAYYRFVYRGVRSRVGRCKTASAPGSTPEKVRLGLVTCQEYTNGYYGAYAHLANEDLDAIVHLGDQIYEYSADPRWRKPRFADRSFGLPSGSYLATNLADFRAIYRNYRDPLMQQALAAHPLIAIWDDHETANDCYWDYTRDTLGAPDHPFRNDPVRLRLLKQAAAQAWEEWVPAAVASWPQNVQSRVVSQRSLLFGNLLELFLTDTRSYRSPHPCGEGDLGQRTLSFCPARERPDRTMLGLNQFEALRHDLNRSQATWQVMASAVMFSPFASGSISINLDGWDGYAYERQKLLEAVAQRDRLVVLSGDLHAALAAPLQLDDRRVGVEFMTPGLTSPGAAETLQRMGLPWPGNVFVEALNPHLAFFEGNLNGYAIVEFTPREVTYELYSVDKSVNGMAAGRRLARRYRYDLLGLKAF